MVDQKEFGVIRNKVMDIRTGFLEHIGQHGSTSFPVVIRVVDVEEDGHICMVVNSKLKKWETHNNLPLKLQLFSQDCHIMISGVGDVTPPGPDDSLILDTPGAKNLLRMKIYYAEYVDIPKRVKAGRNLLARWANLFEGFSERISGRSYRRLLIFR
jgi:hypothetical protein